MCYLLVWFAAADLCHVVRLPGWCTVLSVNYLADAGEALRILVNQASKIERAQYLNVRPHERTSERADYANGLKQKTVMTRVGEQTFDVPQVRGVKFIVSDDHAGLKAARRDTLPSVPWQRCQFHLQQNAQAYVTRLDQRTPVTQRIRAIFNAADKPEAERLLKQAIELWSKEAPKLAAWAELNLPMGFAVFDLPAAHRTRIRTTNGLERINRELKRLTRVASIFPNAASCLRLVSALLAECDEEWMSGKIYLTLNA